MTTSTDREHTAFKGAQPTAVTSATVGLVTDSTSYEAEAAATTSSKTKQRGVRPKGLLREMNNMNREPPPPYNPYYPPQYPNATQGNFGQPIAGMMPPAGQPTAGMMPPTVEHVNMGIPDSAPPEYSLGFEDENCFSDATIRRGFIRKVYLTLMVQLLITVGIICAFLYWETLNDWVKDTYWFTYTMMCATFVLIFVLICCPDIRRKVPLNFIFLALFTIIEGLLLGSVVVYYSAEAVLWAVGATALVSLALSLFSLQSKWDFTGLSGSVWVLCWTLFSFGLLCAILRSQYLYIFYASLGTLIFSMYLVMDTQLILGGKHKYSINPEEYIFAALNLYLDIVTIFLLLLQLIGLCR
ncbi:hypothetical protein Q8A67_007746 [Cirrhinus molitorella]|uniref:Protein lifeguard 1-like n=1 Tax=Cirrhinus molitorella TaxID=172907 RepID=A0AA88Q0D5_9TELE|nr:hypothetical protein Q8A67_007746 [Cirrhinus molitorella]